MKKIHLFIEFLLAVFLLLCITALPGAAQLNVQYLDPGFGILGQELEVTAKGTGFDENTRAIMYQEKTNIIASKDIGGNARGISISGLTAYISYIADDEPGLQIMDISDPLNPVITASLLIPGNFNNIAVEDDIVYIAAGNEGLQIVNVSNSNSPYIITSLALPDYAEDIIVKDKTAYIAAGDSGLLIVDVSNPSEPKISGSLPTSHFAKGIAVSNNRAYIIESRSWNESAFEVIDISDKSHPVLMGSKDIDSSSAYDIDVSGNYVYIADWYVDLIVMDVKDPYRPEIKNHLTTSNFKMSTSHIKIHNNIAFINNSEYLQFFDISNPLELTILGAVKTNDSILGIDVSDNMVFAANSESGLTVIPSPVEIVPVLSENQEQITLNIPDPKIAGEYNLRFVNGREKFEMENVVSFQSSYPDVYISPQFHTFSIIDTGTDSPVHTFVVTNFSSTPVEIRDISITGNHKSEFSIQNNTCSGKQILPSEKCVIDVNFSPRSPGEKNADLSISVNTSSGIQEYKAGLNGWADEQGSYKFKRMWPTLQQPWYFSYPDGLAVDKKGFIYLMDKGNHRMMKFTSNGQLVTQWGKKGDDKGEFFFDRIYIILGGVYSDRCDLAVDNEDNIYVMDTGNNRIQKFDSKGNFITSWGKDDYPEYSFDSLNSLVIDNENNVWTVNSSGIYKFSPEGELLEFWEAGQGDIPEELYSPLIRVSSKGVIHLVSVREVFRFNMDGTLINTWETPIFMYQLEPCEGCPYTGITGPVEGMAVDYEGNTYIASPLNGYVYKYDLQGNEMEKWKYFSGYGERYTNSGGYMPMTQQYWANMVFDKDGNLYISHERDNFIMKTTPSGELLGEWGNLSEQNKGNYGVPARIAVHPDDKLFVVDSKYSKINIYDLDGKYLDNKFYFIIGGSSLYHKDIVLKEDRYIYALVSDDQGMSSVVKDDEYLDQLTGWDVGEFTGGGLGIDNHGNIYVGAGGLGVVKKYSPHGELLIEYQDEYLMDVSDVAVDTNGFVYALDKKTSVVCKFMPSGELKLRWGGDSYSESQLTDPESIDIDSLNRIFIADKGADRVKVFTSQGIYLGKIGNGKGNLPGQMFEPTGVAVSSKDDFIYVAESGNERLQSFQYTMVNTNAKAIILAGDGPDANNIWEAAKMCANFAYRTLVSQGFTKESIYYMSIDTDLDLDNNFEDDDVDSEANLEKLEYAVRQWASDADSLVIYLVDHGDKGTFRVNYNEVLQASTLDLWLDELQETMTGNLVIIYEACESGTFLSELDPPEGRQRTLVTSTSPGELAYFENQGILSFSFSFWSHIFHGRSISKSFDLTLQAMEAHKTTQHPLLDANGNGKGCETEDKAIADKIFIGNATSIAGEAPVIAQVVTDSLIENTSSAVITAEGVSDPDGISRVWAVINPPAYHSYSSSNPLLGLPYVDLMKIDEGKYQAVYHGFHIEDTYQVAVYAADKIGNTSIPVITSISVTNPMRRKAILLCAGSEFDKYWPVIEQNGYLAYEALKFQGYKDDDIYFLSPVTFAQGVRGTPCIDNLEYAVNTWAGTYAQDLLIYMIGTGEQEKFQLNSLETLDPATLDTWLDHLQEKIPGAVTIINDACYSQNFVSRLTAPVNKKRILISSTSDNQPVNFVTLPEVPADIAEKTARGGNLSFSQFFWKGVMNGSDVDTCFTKAAEAVAALGRWSGKEQVPSLDDNNNGIGNEKNHDGNIASNHSIGFGIMMAGDEPSIGSFFRGEVLKERTGTDIWVENVITTGQLDQVWAVISPPGAYASSECAVEDIVVITLPYNQSSQRYEVFYDNFIEPGRHTVTFYARDAKGNISLPSAAPVVKGCRFIQGDINTDEVIDLADAIVGLKILAEDETAQLPEKSQDIDYLPCIDVNNDKKIGIEEIYYILNQSVK